MYGMIYANLQGYFAGDEALRKSSEINSISK